MTAAAAHLVERGRQATVRRRGLECAVAAGKLQVLAPFHLDAIERDGHALIARGAKAVQDAAVTLDEIIVAAGFRPDLAPLGERRLGLDPALECPMALAPLIDPTLHSCGTVRPHGAACCGPDSPLAAPKPAKSCGAKTRSRPVT